MSAQPLPQGVDRTAVAPPSHAGLQHEPAEFVGVLTLTERAGVKVWTCAVHGEIPWPAITVRAARLRCGRCEKR